jgi:glycosyltransferase involved in cell wall biosynthesis
MDVEVLSSEGAETSLTPRIYVLPAMKTWGFRELARLYRAIKQAAPDLVHFQFPTQGYAFRWMPALVPLVAMLAGTRVVRTWHGIPNLRDSPRFLLQAIVPGRFIFVHPDWEGRLPWVLRALRVRQRAIFIPNASAIPKSDLTEIEKQGLRGKYLQGAQRLIVFFGFIYRHKGVERIFEIADPTTDHIVIAGKYDDSDPYIQELRALAGSAPWVGRVTVLGYLPPRESADLLAVADAVVLPFREGSGTWNTSVHAALAQGTLVVTTSKEATGFDEQKNIFYAPPDDVRRMNDALTALCGKKHDAPGMPIDWQAIAAAHARLYEELAGPKRH